MSVKRPAPPRLALITLSEQGAHVMRRLADSLPEATCFVHDSVKESMAETRFTRVVDLTRALFGANFPGLVFVAPTGVAVRAVAPLLRHKSVDPAVVVVDVQGRWSISLVGGHEAGANDLAVRVANALGAEPVITTTSEAARTVIVGVGCRKGVGADAIVGAVEAALRETGVDASEVRLLASATVKAREPGLREAAERLGIPLVFVPDEEIRQTRRQFQVSEVARARVDLPAVAEPAALLAGRRTRLILPRKAGNGITVALAREDSL